MGEASTPWQRFYIGNLQWEVTEDELREAIKTVAPNTMLSMPKDEVTNRFKGFAFVSIYMGGKTIEDVIDALVKIELRGRTLHPEVANRRPEIDRNHRRG